ncbi:MAG TPA: hypothetical protein VLH08_01385 [Acidobacteriota bacterium]|nr:hypothetical protein [Acidobacteriota bacterium]
MRFKTDPGNVFTECTLGSGTKLQTENASIFIDAHEEDLIFLSQSDGCLSITVTDTTVELDPFESQQLVVRNNPACVAGDDTVKISVKGLFQRPPDHPKSTSKSAGLVFRGLYRKWQLNNLFKPNKKS